MKRTSLFLSLLILFFFLTLSPLQAMPLAGVRHDGYYLTYNVQAGTEGIQFYNINGDFGFNQHLGLGFGYFHTGENKEDYLDILFKFKAFDERNFRLTAIWGVHGSTLVGIENTSAGLIYSHRFSDNIDFSASIQAPWGGGKNLGYSLGMSLHLTPRSTLQWGFRSLVTRENSFGLVLGLITEL